AIACGANHNLLLGPNVPPTATPQTVSGSANSDLLVRLSGADTNGDMLSFRVISLPIMGALYQYSGTGRGAPITKGNTTVNDSSGRVIFAPELNGAGS